VEGAVPKSYSNAPVVKDRHDNLYAVNARYLLLEKLTTASKIANLAKAKDAKLWV